MSYQTNWRRLCIFVWLICHDRLGCGLEVIPFSPSPGNAQPLTQRASLRPNASCPVKGHNACGNGAPDSFCCPSDKTCVVVAESTTVLCCPKGASCDVISTIICDVTTQDVVEHPDSPIHTTKLDESLPVCGDRCCPFGYKCRGGSACVLDEEQEAQTSSSSTNIIVTKTKVTFVSTLPGFSSQTTTTATTTSAEKLPASTTPPVSRAQEISAPTPTAPSQPQTSSPANSSEKSTSSSVIAGTTIAAVSSVAGLACLLWFKRRSISEKVGSARFPRPWQQLRADQSEQDVSLPRYNSPPPAYNNMEAKPAQQHYTFKHYSPESVGDNVPVELPATPVSFSVWNNPRSPRWEGDARRARSHYEPYRRPE